MRYLRKYNEEFTGMTDPNLIKLVDDLKKLADDCLAYLYDDGFSVSVGRKSYGPTKGYLPEFSILKKKGEVDEYNTINVERFTWDEIKDDFIPFLELCKDKYLFINEVIFNAFGPHKVPVDHLINDNLSIKMTDFGKRLVSISFFIENK